MGIIPGPDADADDSCGVCFPAGQTPSTLKVFFNGIKPAQLAGGASMAAYNQYFDVPRIEGEGCKFQTAGDGQPQVRVSVARPFSWVSMGHEGKGGIFQSGAFPPCKEWFENARVWANSYGHKGYCEVSFPGDKSCPLCNSICSLASRIESFTPMIDPDPRMECFPMADEKIVIRYAGKRDATNIHIKFDTNP